MKQNSLGTKALMIAVTVALAAYFGFQAVRYFADPLTTTLAYNYRVEESENLSGFVVLLDSEGRQQVIYKHAISTIAPVRNVDLTEELS